jgi:hypothetical protein
MAVNVCWTFGYGNREDYDLADRFESHKVYMNPHDVVAKIKEIRETTETEPPDYFSGEVWFGVDIDDVETLLTHCKPNSSHLIWMDKYRGEWFSVREIKW